MPQRSPVNYFQQVEMRFEALEKRVKILENQSILTAPQFNPSSLPHDMQGLQIFIGTDNKLYIYIIGTGAIKVGP